jgi:hypothetical protein
MAGIPYRQEGHYRVGDGSGRSPGQMVAGPPDQPQAGIWQGLRQLAADHLPGELVEIGRSAEAERGLPWAIY